MECIKITRNITLGKAVSKQYVQGEKLFLSINFRPVCRISLEAREGGTKFQMSHATNVETKQIQRIEPLNCHSRINSLFFNRTEIRTEQKL